MSEVNKAGGDASDPKPQDAAAEALKAEELALIARSQQGDAAAFGELVTRYRQRVFAMIYQMVRNEQEAWDVAQDTFLKAWRNIAGFRGECSLFSWFYRIGHNLVIDWSRRKKMESAGEFDDSIAPRGVAPGAMTVPQGVAAPVEKLSDQELRGRIDEAILKLSPEHRQVIVLREIEGLEYTEIAEAVGIPIGSVMSRLFYARKKLQTHLRDVYEQL